MDTDYKIKTINGRTIILNEVHVPKIDNLIEHITVESLGMSVDKIKESHEKIQKLLGSDDEVVRTIAFVNVNGMSNLMNSTKYANEINNVKKLGKNTCKQSFLRIYWKAFQEVNIMQLDNRSSNYYMRKAQKLNVQGDFRHMHFAFEYDESVANDNSFISLKDLILSKKGKI
jgi:hypothetical protein